MPPNQNPIFAAETKDFIHSGPIDWFNNPIPAPDAFEEGNMVNISPTIKIDISIKHGIVEEITIGAACTPQEITAYKTLSQEYRDIFAWSYTEMPSLDPSIVEHHIDTWPDITPSSSMGSASRHLNHSCPWVTFHPEPPGCLFLSWSGTHAHYHIYHIHAHIFDFLQILFTLGICFSYVQVLASHPSTSLLQVYTQHWHVVLLSISHFHFQSHPLIFTSRFSIPISAVPTPPFASSVL